MKAVFAKYQKDNSELSTSSIGALKDLMDSGDILHFNGSGKALTIINNETKKRVNLTLSQSVRAALKNGEITKLQIGNCEVYPVSLPVLDAEGNETGEDKEVLFLGVPAGTKGVNVDGSTIIEAAEANPIISKTVSFEDMQLTDFVA